MPTVTFKAKINNGYVKIPRIRRHHCNMREFSDDSKFGGYTNSLLFENKVDLEVKKLTEYTGRIDINEHHPDIVIDTSKLLAVVRITVK